MGTGQSKNGSGKKTKENNAQPASNPAGGSPEPAGGAPGGPSSDASGSAPRGGLAEGGGEARAAAAEPDSVKRKASTGAAHTLPQATDDVTMAREEQATQPPEDPFRSRKPADPVSTPAAADGAQGAAGSSTAPPAAAEPTQPEEHRPTDELHEVNATDTTAPLREPAPSKPEQLAPEPAPPPSKPEQPAPVPPLVAEAAHTTNAGPDAVMALSPRETRADEPLSPRPDGRSRSPLAASASPRPPPEVLAARSGGGAWGGSGGGDANGAGPGDKAVLNGTHEGADRQSEVQQLEQLVQSPQQSRKPKGGMGADDVQPIEADGAGEPDSPTGLTPTASDAFLSAFQREHPLLADDGPVSAPTAPKRNGWSDGATALTTTPASTALSSALQTAPSAGKGADLYKSALDDADEMLIHDIEDELSLL